jgi:leader peptidase (prepilin peptidase)/N-methyltransferase
MCPSCQAKIPFYDNVPVTSYIWLRGRCRHCGTAISLRYPLVELVSGLFAVAVFARYGLSWESLFVYVLVAALLVITFIDIDHQIIPDVITYPGIVVGFIMSLAVGHITYKESMIGIILGGGVLLSVAWGYYLVTKREGMGGGDIKLLAMIGAFLGWKGVIFTIFVGSAIGAAVGGVLSLRTKAGRRQPIPFGPFLSLGALLFLFFGPRIIGLYVQILR